MNDLGEINKHNITKIQKLAEKGDGNSQFQLGLTYGDINNAYYDNFESIYWFKKAADQGHDAAQYKMGCIYLRGDGVLQDTATAVNWFLLSANKNNSDAQYALAKMYATGDVVKQDLNKADQLYETLVEKINGVHEQYNIASGYYSGGGLILDKSKAAKWFKKAAEQGHANAQYVLGTQYFKGEGVEEDIIESIYWIKKAALQEHPEACYWLAELFRNGEFVQEDSSQAMHWYKKAIELGHIESINKFAILLFELDRDDLEVNTLFEKYFILKFARTEKEPNITMTLDYLKVDISSIDEAVAGNWYAYLSGYYGSEADVDAKLAEMYLNGDIVMKDLDRAERYLRCAAESGQMEYQYQYASMIHDEIFSEAMVKTSEIHESSAEYGCRDAQLMCPEPTEIASRFYDNAASQGHLDAKFRLAQINYEQKGNGVFNIDNAINWCKEAASQGHNLAIQFMPRLYSEKGSQLIKDYSESLNEWIANGIPFEAGETVKEKAEKWFEKSEKWKKEHGIF